jgi:hypothetical protein
MSVEVFKTAYRFRRNGELVPFDELVKSLSLLIEVTYDYNRRKSTAHLAPRRRSRQNLSRSTGTGQI